MRRRAENTASTRHEEDVQGRRMMNREYHKKSGAPRAAEVAAAFADRSASLPVHRANARARGSCSQQIVPSNLGYLKPRKSAALTTGEVVPSCRLDRTRNLELAIRQSLLIEFKQDQALAREYFLMVLGEEPTGTAPLPEHHQGEHGNSEASGSHSVMHADEIRDGGRNHKGPAKCQHQALSTARQFAVAEKTLKQREIVEALKLLAGPSWVRSAHATDLDFMSEMLCQRDGAHRMANRLFPGAILDHTKHHRSANSVFSSTATSVERPESTLMSKSKKTSESNAARGRQSSICRRGPFDDFEIRKQHALCGLETATDTSSKQSEAANLFMTYRQCRSPVPVPSQWARDDFKTIETLTRQSATQTPPVRLKPLHFWCGAGRTDGRTIPLVVPVLQASSATGEQILAAGCVVLAEAPCSVLQIPSPEITACAMNETIAATTMQAAALNDTEREKPPSLKEHVQAEKEEKQERQRRFSGHIHQITAFAVSPCGLYVASASIGPTRDSSVLLAWRLSDGLPLNVSPGEHNSAAGEGVDREVGPVLNAGGCCVLAKGCFDGGVGGLAWSLDSRQLVAVDRSWKNILRCYHVRPKRKLRGEASEDDVFETLVSSSKSAASATGGVRAMRELFAKRTMDELPPAIRCVAWFGPARFATFGEKGHVCFWQFSANAEYPTNLSDDLCTVSLRSAVAKQKDGSRAVLQSALVIEATLLASLPPPSDGQASIGESELSELSSVCGFMVAGGTDGSMYFFDPESDPLEGVTKCLLRVDGAHNGTGSDGRVEAMPFHGALDGLTSIALLSSTVRATFNLRPQLSIPSKVPSVHNSSASSSGEQSSLATVVTFTSRPGMHRGGTLSILDEEVPTPERPERKHQLGRAELDVVVATGGCDGRVRLWRISAFFLILPAMVANKTNNLAAEDLNYTNKDPSSSTDSEGRSWRLILDKKTKILVEPLSDLTLQVSRAIDRQLLPLARSMDAPRCHPLHGFVERPSRIKAIQILSDAYDTSIIVVASNKETWARLGSGVSILVSTDGGYVMNASLMEPLSNLVNSTSDTKEVQDRAWSLTITNAGHYCGPSIGLAQHPIFPGLFFSLSSDRSLLAWLTTNDETSLSGFTHKLIGCLQFQKLPSAIGVSPVLVAAKDTQPYGSYMDQPSGAEGTPTSATKISNQGSVRTVQLSVGFCDGSVLELDLALQDSINENSSVHVGGPVQALWWEERTWYSGAKCGYDFAERSSTAGDIDVKAPPRVTCLAYGMRGRILGVGRNDGHVQMRVAAAYKGRLKTCNGRESSEAGADYRWLISRKRNMFEIKAHASAVSSIDFSVADEVDPRKGAKDHGSKGVERFEGLAFRCAMRTSDTSREVRFFQANLFVCAADNVHKAEAEQSIPAADRSLAAWRIQILPAQSLDCRDAVYPSWTCLYGLQVLGIWSAMAMKKQASSRKVKIAEVSALHACEHVDVDSRGTLEYADGNILGNVGSQEASITGLDCKQECPGKGLVLVGNSDGVLRLLSTPALAATSKANFAPRAHVGPIVSCRFASLPQKQLNASSNVTETTMAASLGKSGLVIALWKLVPESSKTSIEQLRKVNVLKGRVPLLAVDDIGPLANPTFFSRVGSAELPLSTVLGPKSLVCFVCGVPSPLSSYVSHVAKCSLVFESTQRDAAFARELPGVRAAPLGPPTPDNAVTAASMAARVAWVQTLPVPHPPEGVHRKFLRSLEHFRPFGDSEGGTVSSTSNVEDTQVLKSLSDKELAEANEDARRAYWEGNTLVCPQCSSRVLWTRAAIHTRYCTPKVHTLRRRADVLVESRQHDGTFTVSRPPIQTRPGIATAREALLQPPPPHFENGAPASAASIASKRAREVTAKAWAEQGSGTTLPGSVQADSGDYARGTGAESPKAAPIYQKPWKPQPVHADAINVTAQGLQLDLEEILYDTGQY